MYQQIIDFVNNTDPFVAAMFGVIVTVAVAIPSILQFKKMKPRYTRGFKRVINRETVPHEGLEFRYKGNIIDTFSETEFYFWNSGNGAIRRSHFLADDPFGIKIDPYVNIYAVQYITTDKMQRTFTILPLLTNDNGLIPIEFDALQKKEGFYINILHSGKEGDSVDLAGSFQDVKKITRANVAVGYSVYRLYAMQIFPILFLLYATIAAFLVIFIFDDIGSQIIFGFFAGSSMCIFVHFLLGIKKRMIPTKLREVASQPDSYIKYDISQLEKED